MFISRQPESYVQIDGSTPLIATWDVGAQRLSNLLNPVAAQDAATKSYVDAAAPSGVVLANGTVPLNAPWNVGGQRLTNLGAPSAASDAATKTYVDTNTVPAATTITGTTPLAVNSVNTPVSLVGGVTLTVDTASAANAGVVTTGTQSFNGVKTFLGGVVVSTPAKVSSTDYLVFNVPSTYEHQFQINNVTKVTVQSDGSLDLGSNQTSPISGALLLKNFTPVLGLNNAGTNFRILIGIDNNDVVQLGDASTTKPINLNSGLVYAQQSVNDVNATIAITSNLVRIVGLTATRTLTLPSAASVTGAFPVKIKDETGNASPTVQIVIQPPAGTIEGSASVAIQVGYGSIDLYSNGSAWFIA